MASAASCKVRSCCGPYEALRENTCSAGADDGCTSATWHAAPDHLGSSSACFFYHSKTLVFSITCTSSA